MFIRGSLKIDDVVSSTALFTCIADWEKHAFARALESNSSHVFLPVSEKMCVFLGTSRDRRVNGDTFIHCLLLAGRKHIAMENYAQKLCWITYNDFLMSLPNDGLFALTSG
jgi:hypothetical protein